MHIIPVIDIKDGIVVHAKHGKRDEYLPLQSTLCRSADIFDVINAITRRYQPEIFYLADLNTLMHQGNNAELILTILADYPDITFWIDAGYPLPNGKWLKLTNFVPVLGSESFRDETLNNDIKQFGGDFILSLDYSTKGELGPLTLFSPAGLWPKRIIIMNLPRVGSNSGPDLEQLMAFRKRYPQHTFIAAGGIRHDGDLLALEQIGIRHALVATALHNGILKPT